MKNKKAFTVVELIIVIAIIAILAAVLIPTFANIIQKANESADIQTVREMNTALAIDGAVTPTTLGKLYDALEAVGIKAHNCEPIVSGRTFWWDKELNMIIYKDENGNLLFPKDVTPSTQLYTLNGKIDTSSATISIPDEVPTATSNYTFEIGSGEDFVKVAEFLSQYNNASLKDATGTITLVFKNDIDLKGADICCIKESREKLSVVYKSDVEGTQRTIRGLYNSDEHASFGNDSQGNVSQTYGHSLFYYIANLTVSDIKLIDSTIGGTKSSQGAFFASQVNVGGTATFTNVTVQNCDVYGKNKNGILVGYCHGSMDLNSVKIDNCHVYTLEGESGIVAGVLERGKVLTTTDALSFDSNTEITNCTVTAVDNSKVKQATSDNVTFNVIQVSDSKWRAGTALICWLADTNAPENVAVTGAVGSGAVYKAINTLSEIQGIKGLKAN